MSIRSPCSFVYTDTQGAENTDLSPAAILSEYPNGAYTTLAAKGENLLDLTYHIRRLIRNVQTLITEGKMLNLSSASKSSGIAVADLLQQAIARVLPEAMKHRGLVTEGDQAMVVLMLSDTDETDPAFERSDFAPAKIGVHIKALSFADLAQAVPVYVVAPARSLPSVKDTAWPTSRKQWQHLVPSDAAEGLLCDKSGHLLEGFITNLFIVCKSATSGILTLQTAPASRVLEGTCRKHVLQACLNLGYDVIFEAPDPQKRNTWEEAFICNALRRIQPISRIECRSDSECILAPWTRTFQDGPGAVTQQLQTDVKHQTTYSGPNEWAEIILQLSEC